jgi:hypothetical protein
MFKLWLRRGLLIAALLLVTPATFADDSDSDLLDQVIAALATLVAGPESANYGGAFSPNG